MEGKAPLIGLNCRYDGHEEYPVLDKVWMHVPYYQALVAVGALPVIVPAIDDHRLLSDFLDKVGGFMFTGGPDVPPTAYGQEKHPRTQEVHPKRFACDRLLAELVLERDMAVLAVCMGQQLINVAYGGTLIQHIETEIQHTSLREGVDSYHQVTIEEGSLLHQILGATEVEVNSGHHQAVGKPAAGLRVLARAPDGIIEAVQMTDKRFFIGVQWHPERLMDRPEQRELLKAFVAAASA
jgi:putative glutamine amidotransferase